MIKRSLYCFLLVLLFAPGSLLAALSVDSSAATGITRTVAWPCANVVSTNGSTNAVSLQLYYGTSDGGTNPASWAVTNIVLSIASTAAVSTNITGLTPAQQYYYTWRLNEGTNSDWSTSTNFWTLAGVPTGTVITASNYPVTVGIDGTLKSPTNLWDKNGIATTGQITSHTGGVGAAVHGLGTASTHGHEEYATAAQGVAGTNAQARVGVVETGKVALASYLSHTGAVGTAVHGLGTASTHGHEEYVTNGQSSVNLGRIITSGGITLTNGVGIEGSASPWTTLSQTPVYGGSNWACVASSADGRVLAAADDGGGAGGYIYVSTNSGSTWAPKGPSVCWSSYGPMDVSANGSVMVAGNYTYGDYIYVSTDTGETWTARGSALSWYSAKCSADGSKMIAANGGTDPNYAVYISSDYGSSWAGCGSGYNIGNFSRCCIDSDGSVMAACGSSTFVTFSTDSGSTWYALDISAYWDGIDCSSDGSVIAACGNAGTYVSTNSGTSWTQVSDAQASYVTVSSNGAVMTESRAGQLYVSVDTGVTWTAYGESKSWGALDDNSDGTKLIGAVPGDNIYLMTLESGVTRSAISNLNSVGTETIAPTSTILKISGNIGPSTSNGYSLGTAALPWSSAYIGDQEITPAKIATWGSAISSVTGPGMTTEGGAVTFSTNGWAFGSGGLSYLTSNTTVNLTNTMSSGEIQAAIDAVPKNLNTKTVTFNLSAGLFNPGGMITVSGFNNGTVSFQGVDVSNVAYYTQSTIISNSANANMFSVEANTASILFSDIRFINVRSSSGLSSIRINSNFNCANLFAKVSDCSFLNTEDKQTFGVLVSGNYVAVVNNCFSGGASSGTAIYANKSAFVFSSGNLRIGGSGPCYGHASLEGALIMRDGSTITGVTDNFKMLGGQISLGNSTWF